MGTLASLTFFRMMAADTRSVRGSRASARSTAFNRLDVWAASVTLYEMLTRELPFGSRVNDPDDSVVQRLVAGDTDTQTRFSLTYHSKFANLFRECFETDPARRSVVTADGLRRALSDLDIRAEWIQMARSGYIAIWEGYEVSAGRKTGTTYEASVRELSRLRQFGAEVKRAMSGGALRRWPAVTAYRGTRAQAVHRMILWMRNITTTGSP